MGDKLENKDASVWYIRECLSIIEKQKVDWFSKLLDFQVSLIASDLAHLSKLLYSGNNPGGDPFKELTLEEIIEVYHMEVKSKSSRRNELD